jgi:hypothetical protein
MAFNPINFMQAPVLRDDRVGSFADSLMKGLTTAFTMRQQQQENERAQQRFDMENALRQKQEGRQDEAYEQSKNPLYQINSLTEALSKSGLPPEQQQAILNQKIYGSALSPEQAHKNKMEESRVGKELSPEQLDYYRALAEQARRERTSSGGYLSAGEKDEKNYLDNISKSNKTFTPEQVLDAGNRTLDGYDTRTDGTPINITPLVKESAGRLKMKGTTAQTVTQDIASKRGDAELYVLNKHIKEGNEQYPSSILGINKDYIADNFKAMLGDETAIDRLSKKAAGELLNVERTLITQNVVQGKTSVAAMKAMLGESAKVHLKKLGIDNKLVENKAIDYMNKAIDDMYKARTDISGSAFSTIKEKGKEKEKNEDTSSDLIPVKGPDGKWRIP